MKGGVEMKEVTTSPWLQMIKRSVSAEQRGSREEGEFAQGWLRRHISRQGSPLVRERRKSQPISQRDKQEEQSLQDPSGAELERTKHSRESPLRAYKPGLWRMAAVRGLRKRRWADTEARWNWTPVLFIFMHLHWWTKATSSIDLNTFKLSMPYTINVNVSINIYQQRFQTCFK